MPEREPRPAGPGSESVTCIGSCDSTMSAPPTRSGSSDSSYDFLSAEEKECLLFLEETIGSLDTEADRGLSTDESEPATSPRGPQAPITQPAPQGHPEETIIRQGPEPKIATPSSSSHRPEPQGLSLRSGSHSLPRNIHIGRNQNLRHSTAQTNSHVPGDSEGLVPAPERTRVSQSSEHGQAPAGPREAGLDLGRVLIPPPEAFRDAQPERRGEGSWPEGPRGRGGPPQLHASLSPQKRETSSEAMSQKASEKGSLRGPGQPQPPPALWSQNARAEGAPLPSEENPNSQLAPLPAAKPRKLPPNIVLKSSRSSFHSNPQNWLFRHSEAAPKDSSLVPSSLQEQWKARREALEKLGLPQDEDESSLHLNKPTSSIRPKETLAQAPSWAPVPILAQPAAPPQVSAAVPASGKTLAPAPAPARGPSPMKALVPALAQGSSPGKISIPAQEPLPGKAAATKSVPIPIPKAPKVNSPQTQPKSDSGLALQKSDIPGLRQMSFKSNTLERSGVGLSSYLSAEKDPSPKTSTSLGRDFLDKTSPSVLRNSRPRPASLGTGKDFAGIQVGKLADLEQEQSSKRLSFPGQSRDKLPRPPCVSVKISPKGASDEHRREALKKLGLLKE